MKAAYHIDPTIMSNHPWTAPCFLKRQATAPFAFLHIVSVHKVAGHNLGQNVYNMCHVRIRQPGLYSQQHHPSLQQQLLPRGRSHPQEQQHRQEGVQVGCPSQHPTYALQGQTSQVAISALRRESICEDGGRPQWHLRPVSASQVVSWPGCAIARCWASCTGPGSAAEPCLNPGGCLQMC